jgi:hypothetical protein
MMPSIPIATDPKQKINSNGCDANNEFLASFGQPHGGLMPRPTRKRTYDITGAVAQLYIPTLA